MPSTTTVRHAQDVERVGSTVHPRLSHTLAAAFHDDPIFRWWIPQAAHRDVQLPAFFHVVVDAVAGHDASYAVADGQGVALWVPPGVEALTGADEEVIADVITRGRPDDAARFFELSALMTDHHPHDDHAYLWFLGVAPTSQGRGLGSALLDHALSRCDDAGVPAYLEATSERNRRLYQRHGFRVTGELAVAGGPPMWAMWREPAAA